jgi:NTE family protein
VLRFSCGYAHIGVIKAPEANGIHIDMVVGTSVGSAIGALYAGGYSGAALEQLLPGLDQSQIRDFELSRCGYLRGRVENYP